MTDKGTVVVDLAGWIGKGAWAGATDASRRGAMDLAVAELLGAKRRQVLAGRGADGQPMPPRKHRRADGATGPVLAPHRTASRSMTRLRHSKVGSGRIVIWWGDGWSRVLSYHGRGLVRHAPVRNVVAFTPATLARVRRKVLAWWGANGEEGVRVGPPAPPPRPAPKPPPPPKEPNLREMIRGKNGPDASEIIADYVRARQSPTPIEVTTHGMPGPEPLHSLEWGGLTWKAPLAHDRSNPLVRTIFSLLQDNVEIPAPIAKHTREVIFSARRNVHDGHWARRYDTPGFDSDATGGDGRIVVYGGKLLPAPAMIHEMGHNLANAKYGDTEPPASSDYGRAVRDADEAPVSKYGANSPAEDFAEAVRLYLIAPGEMRLRAPKRFEVIDRLAKEADYGG